MTSAKHLPKMRMLGILRKGPSSFNVNGQGTEFAGEIWREFIDQLLQAGVPLNQDLYGVSWPADDSTPPQEIYYFCGFASSEVLPGFEELHFEGGNYFEYRCEVPANDLDAGFQAAYLDALPKSGLEPREGQHLELYGDEYDPQSPIARFRILIPVR